MTVMVVVFRQGGGVGVGQIVLVSVQQVDAVSLSPPRPGLAVQLTGQVLHSELELDPVDQLGPRGEDVGGWSLPSIVIPGLSSVVPILLQVKTQKSGLLVRQYNLAPYILFLWPANRQLKVPELVEIFHDKNVLVQIYPAVFHEDLQSRYVGRMFHRAELLTKHMARLLQGSQYQSVTQNSPEIFKVFHLQGIVCVNVNS